MAGNHLCGGTLRERETGRALLFHCKCPAVLFLFLLFDNGPRDAYSQILGSTMNGLTTQKGGIVCAITHRARPYRRKENPHKKKKIPTCSVCVQYYHCQYYNRPLLPNAVGPTTTTLLYPFLRVSPHNASDLLDRPHTHTHSSAEKRCVLLLLLLLLLPAATAGPACLPALPGLSWWGN